MSPLELIVCLTVIIACLFVFVADAIERGGDQ